MQPGPDQIWGLELLFPHAPATCIVDWFECCTTTEGSSGAHQETKRILEVFLASPFCLAKRWQAFFWRPQSGRRSARQPSTVVLGVHLLSIFVDSRSKDLLPDVAMLYLSGTPGFESKANVCRFHRRICTDDSLTNSPFNCSKTAKLREPSTPNWPSQPLPSLLDLSVTVTLGLQLFSCFRAWFSFGIEFFSLLQPRDRFFFFFFSFPVTLSGRQKSDTARCHWQREVNVIRRPLPQATGRTWESLHASCRSKCIGNVTEHEGTLYSYQSVSYRSSLLSVWSVQRLTFLPMYFIIKIPFT